MSASRDAARDKAEELGRISNWAGEVGEYLVRDLCRDAAMLLYAGMATREQEQEQLPPAPFLDMGDRIIAATGTVYAAQNQGPAGEVRARCPHCGSTKIRAEETQNVCQECGKGITIAGALLSGKSFPEVASEFDLSPVRRDRSHDIPQGIPEEQG